MNMILSIAKYIVIPQINTCCRDLRGRNRMLVELSTTFAISAYQC